MNRFKVRKILNSSTNCHSVPYSHDHLFYYFLSRIAELLRRIVCLICRIWVTLWLQPLFRRLWLCEQSHLLPIQQASQQKRDSNQRTWHQKAWEGAGWAGVRAREICKHAHHRSVPATAQEAVGACLQRLQSSITEVQQARETVDAVGIEQPVTCFFFLKVSSCVTSTISRHFSGMFDKRWWAGLVGVLLCRPWSLVSFVSLFSWCTPLQVLATSLLCIVVSLACLSSP